MNPIFHLLSMQPTEGGSGMQTIIMMLLVIVIFYFFFIRPQMKKTKDLKKFRENLKKGDKIITIGGIHGKILEVQEKTFIIEVEGQNRLKIEKSAVALEGSSEPIATNN